MGEKKKKAAEAKDGGTKDFGPEDAAKMRNIYVFWVEQAKGLGINLTRLDRDCWVAKEKRSGTGERQYRLDKKDGEVEIKLTYVGPKIEEKETSKWAEKATRKDKYGHGWKGKGGW